MVSLSGCARASYKNFPSDSFMLQMTGKDVYEMLALRAAMS